MLRFEILPILLYRAKPNLAENRTGFCVRGRSSDFQRPHPSSAQQTCQFDSTALYRRAEGPVGICWPGSSPLLKDFRLDSFYIGFNNRAAAGQTVAHAHIHIIPRHHGDVPDPLGGIRWVVAESA